MILYHGSVVPVEEPGILAGFRLLDFGQGFYTTRSYEQAERWAKTKMKREGKDVGYVSVYEFNDVAAKEALQIREFAQADAQWLRFVVNNYRGTQVLPQADIDIGPVADDNVYASIRLFETNVLDEDETIKRLNTERCTTRSRFTRMLTVLQYKCLKHIQFGGHHNDKALTVHRGSDFGAFSSAGLQPQFRRRCHEIHI